MTPLTPQEVTEYVARGHRCYTAHVTGAVRVYPPLNVEWLGPYWPTNHTSTVEYVDRWAECGVTFWLTEAEAKAHLERIKVKP